MPPRPLLFHPPRPSASAACNDAFKLCGDGGCGALLVTNKYATEQGGDRKTCCAGLGERGAIWGGPVPRMPPGRCARGKGCPFYGLNGVGSGPPRRARPTWGVGRSKDRSRSLTAFENGMGWQLHSRRPKPLTDFGCRRSRGLASLFNRLQGGQADD
jgi:hypothetical protein